jgi:uncharacterized protein (TIGR02996 family)
MILHVAELPSAERLFWVESRFEEKNAVKSAGMIWHSGTGCRPSCGACAAGIGKVWWTRKEDAARQLLDYADAEAKRALTGKAKAPAKSRAPKAPQRKIPKGTPDLLVQILDDPDNLALKQVYADWLLERGDPRGELIRVQIEREHATGERAVELEKIEKRLLRKHQSSWVGIPVRGMRWRHGFLYGVTMNQAAWIDGAAALLSTEPVRRVRITGLRNLPGVADMPELGLIAALGLPDDRIEHRGLARLLASPQVQNLRGLELNGNSIGEAGAVQLAATPFAALVELRLFACGIGLAGLKALLAAPFLPRLRELDLRANYLGSENPTLGKLLGEAPFAAGMMLDLAHNEIDDRIVKDLVASKLPRLAMDVEMNSLKPAARAKLAARFTVVDRDRTSTGELHDEAALDPPA